MALPQVGALHCIARYPMKFFRCLASGMLVFVCSHALAIERLPIEDFSKEPLTSRARLSPDGKRMAFIRDYRKRPNLHVADLDAGTLSRLELGGALVAGDVPKGISKFTWVGDERLVITTTVWDMIYGAIAVNWDGAYDVPISGYEDNKISISGGPKFSATAVVHCFFDKDNNVLMLDHDSDDNYDHLRPDVIKMNTVDGIYETVVKNPGNVSRWGFDFTGVARFGVLKKGEDSGAIYRRDEKSPWQTILPLEKRDGQLQPIGFDAANDRLFVSAFNQEKRRAIFPFDPASGSQGEALLGNPEYDIIPDRFIPSIDGVSLAGPMFSRKKQSLIGLRYYTELPRVKWLDRDFAMYQLAADKNFPDTVNLLVDQSADGNRLLWFGFSDQNPGVYYLLDLKKKNFKAVGTVRPWIKPAQMAPTLGVKYTARDGLVIHGYLTVPLGHPSKGLPLVVMPHGGPWVRDVWGFNPLVQLLANRGYAVLQMNYRGSTGYGDELYQQAKREIGGKIQDDIEDATRWALAAGLADPKRIAIMGMSYGGYSTLFALGKNPELYRCGISIAGVTDWPAMYEDSDVAENKAAKKYWRQQIGDPDKDLARLQSVSPYYFADQITAPVLIIQGKRDQRVPQDQAKRMIAALEKAGRKPESLFVSNLAHTHGDEKQRTEIYKSIVDFLEKNLGPGVP